MVINNVVAVSTLMKIWLYKNQIRGYNDTTLDSVTSTTLIERAFVPIESSMIVNFNNLV